MQNKPKIKFRNILTTMLLFVLNNFFSIGQTRGAYIVEKYFINEQTQGDFALEKGMELIITRSLDDGYYYLTNRWDSDGTYTSGVMNDWEEIDKEVMFDFDITQKEENVHVYDFVWLFENKFDKFKGKATGLFIEYIDECNHYFICVVTIKAKDLVLRYEGYRE